MSRLDELVEQALALHRDGQLDDAASRYETVLAEEPARFEALHMLGVVRLQQSRLHEALPLMQRALQIRSDSADAHCDYAFALKLANRFEESTAHLSQALSLEPDFVDAIMARGMNALEMNRGLEAAADFERVLNLVPNSQEALFRLGQALMKQKRFEEAVACFDALLTVVPEDATTLNERGIALCSLNRHEAGIESFGRAIATGVPNAGFFVNRAHAWLALHANQQALDDLDRAVALAPEFASAYRSRGHALTNLKRLDEAAASYNKAAALDPDLPYALGYAVQSRAQLCDWTDYDGNLERMVHAVRMGRPACDPFALLCYADDPADQLACARSFVDANFPAVDSSAEKVPRRRHDRIRIAYLSADFHDHATAYLIAELFELHDRHRFEVVAVSFGPDSDGAMRKRLRAGADRFIDVRAASDAEVAELMRDAEVDLAIDLKGHTLGSRPGIFARRAAPIQVNFLGYPGTTGATFIDYIIADDVVIPQDHERFYTEAVIRLPGSYQVNDSKRRIADRIPARSEVGLPEGDVVFCCFNGNYKITPAMFDVWTALLEQVDDSVLWLLRGTASAETNLRRETANRGIDPSRLVFAPFAPLADHLARHRLADLFLDTIPCNAHTTASDALWAGLPVLTCEGRSFASRVASSLLHALHMPELVTHSLPEYRERALQLASDSDALLALKAKLAHARRTAPLFGADQFRRHLEAAYQAIFERNQRGQPPTPFRVVPQMPPS